MTDVQSRLQAVIDTAVDGVIIIDALGHIQMYNPACERLFGYASGEVLGENVKRLMPSPYREEHDGYLDAYKRTGEAGIIGIGREVLGRRKDGSVFPMELSVGEAREGGERIFVGIIRDISERKREEAELAESVKEMEAFAYSVAHDLKAPLRAINGFSEALTEDYGAVLDQAGREFLQHIAAGATRMGRLIDDLLEYSRLGRGELRMRQVDLAEIVERVKENLITEIQVRNAEILVEGDLPVIEAHPETLVQVLQNIVANALKFIADGVTPRVVIRGGRNGRYGTLTISDNGIGMERKYLSRIFDIFHRLHLGEDYPGTGIGLAIVKKGVQRHHGRIEVESGPGKGTTFTLDFPLRQPREPATEVHDEDE